jgi:hypothetical protein
VTPYTYNICVIFISVASVRNEISSTHCIFILHCYNKFRSILLSVLAQWISVCGLNLNFSVILKPCCIKVTFIFIRITGLVIL